MYTQYLLYYILSINISTDVSDEWPAIGGVFRASRTVESELPVILRHNFSVRLYVSLSNFYLLVFSYSS